MLAAPDSMHVFVPDGTCMPREIKHSRYQTLARASHI